MKEVREKLMPPRRGRIKHSVRKTLRGQEVGGYFYINPDRRACNNLLFLNLKLDREIEKGRKEGKKEGRGRRKKERKGRMRGRKGMKRGRNEGRKEKKERRHW